jgi:putative ABC transport system permease protein
MLVSDVVAQCLVAPTGRPVRSALTILGTVVGVGALVTTLGLTASARSAVNQRFDALASTEIDATAMQGSPSTTITNGDSGAVHRLVGVVAAGVARIQISPEPAVTDSGAPEATGPGTSSTGPGVASLSVGAMKVVNPQMSCGVLYDRQEESRRARVALVGSAAAAELRITSIPAKIHIDGSAFLVIGIIAKTERESNVLLDVVIPNTTEEALLGSAVTAPPTMVVATRPGFAGPVESALARTIDPEDFGAISVTSPPSPVALQAAVSSELTGLFTVLTLVGLIIGIVSIANITLVSVLERVHEIGLRRAIGARKGQIAIQFVLESIALGYLGGLFGTAGGLATIATIAVLKTWTPVLPLWVILVAPQTGALTGLLAGAYPAMRAASVDPMAALSGS